MHPLAPRPPQRQINWFALAVVLVLLGGLFLVIYTFQRDKAGSTSAGQGSSQFYTQAAQTFAALQTQAISTPTLPPADTSTALPSMTSFPTYFFTPPTASLASPSSTALSQGNNYCDNSVYVSDVTIPDGTIMAPGTAFVKTWAFQNIGSCTWNTSYRLIFFSGEQMGGAATNLTVSVAPSQQVKASVSLTAPATDGTYTGYWRLANAQGAGFGGVVFVKIVVSKNAPTTTPTPTLTLTRTPTAKTAATGMPTATASLTNTPTSNPPTATHTPSYTPLPSATDTPPATSTSPPTSTPSETPG
jgi:Ig-like domain from next to BRCA1 gene